MTRMLRSPCRALAGNLPNRLRRGPPIRSASRTPNSSNEIRHTRVLPAVLGFGALAGAAVYLFYPDASRSAPTSTKRMLSASHFTPTTVTSNESCGPDTKLLELTVPPHLLPPRDSPDTHFVPVWSVFIKDDDIQVERPYTPLEGVDEHGRMLFWIKKYPKGEVGRWLHSRNVGEQVELRGPLRTWPWKDDTWDEIVMVCKIYLYNVYSRAHGSSDLGRNRHHSILPTISFYHIFQFLSKYPIYSTPLFSDTCRPSAATNSRHTLHICLSAS